MKRVKKRAKPHKEEEDYKAAAGGGQAVGSQRGLKEELIAICGLAGALFLLLSLLSYSQGDYQANWFGRAGYGVSLGWLALFGLGAYLSPFLLAWPFIRLLRGVRPLRPVRFACLSLALLASISTLLAVLGDTSPLLAERLTPFVFQTSTSFATPLSYHELKVHIGGIPFTLLYTTLPMLNLKELLNPLGTALLALFATALTLFVLTGSRLFDPIKSLTRHLLASLRSRKAYPKALVIEEE